MLKRGNALLIYTLIMASFNICKYNKSLIDNYLKKQVKERFTMLHLGSVLVNLVRIIFKVIKYQNNPV